MRKRHAVWLAAFLSPLTVGVLWLVVADGGEAEVDDVGTSSTAVAAPAVTEGSPPPSDAALSAQDTTSSPTVSTTTTLVPSTTTSTSTTLSDTTPTTAASPATDSYSPVFKPIPGPNSVAPGGALTKHLVEDIALAFGIDAVEVEAAIAAIELPPEARGNPEGWLAPGTYQPVEGFTTQDLIQEMVDRRVAQLEARGIAREQWYRVLTAASVIEKETYNQNEKPRVARVLTNRLAGGGPLQMDSIILYPVPEDRIFTNSEERASDQPYNSYKHNGLPPTPICSPDEAAIDAFLAPPAGDWWFYVTINLDSGETRYAVTYEEHRANVELLRAWLRENPTP